jgi:hypothetical protein
MIITVCAIRVILIISDWSTGSSWTSKMSSSLISKRHYDFNNLIIVTVVIIIIIVLPYFYQLQTPSLILHTTSSCIIIFLSQRTHHRNLNLIHTLERLVMASLIRLTSWSSLASSCLTSILGGVKKSVQ